MLVAGSKDDFIAAFMKAAAVAVADVVAGSVE